MGWYFCTTSLLSHQRAGHLSTLAPEQSAHPSSLHSIDGFALTRQAWCTMHNDVTDHHINVGCMHCVKGIVSQLLALKKDKMDINATDKDGQTALHWALTLPMPEVALSILKSQKHSADCTIAEKIGGQ